MKVSHHCYPQVKDIKMEIVYALKKGVTAWYVFLQIQKYEGVLLFLDNKDFPP